MKLSLISNFLQVNISLLVFINLIKSTEQNLNDNIANSPQKLLNNAQLITLFNRQRSYWYGTPTQNSVYPSNVGLGTDNSGTFRSNNAGISNNNIGGINGFSLFNTFESYPSKQIYDSYAQPIMTPSKITRIPSLRADKKQYQQNPTENCGIVKPKIGNFVHRGEPTEHHTWPWHVQLTISGNDATESETYCGGTLIAKNLILTAAHCYDDLQATKRAKNTQISFKGIENVNLKQFSPRSIFPNGLNSQKDDSFLKLRAHFVHIHPKYVPALSEYDAKIRGVTPGPVYDLALIEIQHDSHEIYNSLMPICLPSDNYQLALGTKCKIMGHGFMNSVDEDNFIMPK